MRLSEAIIKYLLYLHKVGINWSDLVAPQIPQQSDLTGDPIQPTLNGLIEP